MTPLEQKLAAMSGYPRVDAALVRRLGDALAASPDAAVARINPRAFAAQHGLDEAATVDLFLVGAKVGLFELQFHLVCPGCGALETTTESWNGLARDNTWCAVCNMEVPVILDDHVEVTFSPAPAVRHVVIDGYKDAATYYGHFFSPSFQRSPTLRAFVDTIVRGFALVQPESIARLPVRFAAGERLRIVSVDAHSSVDVDIADAGDPVAMIELVPSGLTPQRTVVRAGDGEIVLQNRRPGAVGVMVVRDALERVREILREHPNTFLPHLSAKELLNQQRFRELFKAQSLDPSLRLQLRSLTLLFTDLKGSTALYDSTGDVTAYSVVQAHFDALMNAVRSHGGAVVKTMGDAVMASFSSPDDALRAADDMLRAMAPLEERVRGLGYATGLKVGIHEGTALAVSSDDRLDYFGQTVNIAARVQALADAGEIWLTEAVMEHPGVAELVKARAWRVEQKSVALKGVGASTAVYRLQAA